MGLFHSRCCSSRATSFINLYKWFRKYANKKLFQPSEYTKYKGSSHRKVTNTAGSLQLRSLNYAKFGQNKRRLGMGNKFYQKNGSPSLSHQTISENEFTDIFGIKLLQTEYVKL
jgi:hypothetical protein